MKNENNLPPGYSDDTEGFVSRPSSVAEHQTNQPTQALARQQQLPQYQEGQAVVSAAFSELPTQPQAVRRSQSSLAANDRMQVGASASQMGLDQPRHSLFGFITKRLLIKGVAILVGAGVVFAILVLTNVIALSRFKTIDYTNSHGTHYKLEFYTKHSSKKLQSGNTQLVSKVSNDGKFPIVLSIDAGTASGYSRAKNCAGFTEVLDVQNSNLNQTISVCDFGKQVGSRLPAGTVYIAGFIYNNQYNITTIAQDYSGINLSSQSAAQQALAEFGLDSYQDDIKAILSSIKVE